MPRVTSDWLRLKNRDLAPGRFLGWDDDAVRWEVAGAPRPGRFRRSGVDRLVWAAPEKPARGADLWVVRLTDGRILPTELGVKFYDGAIVTGQRRGAARPRGFGPGGGQRGPVGSCTTGVPDRGPEFLD